MDSLARILEPYKGVTCYLAFSGGLDSTVLLHLCSRLRAQDSKFVFTALHVHHGLDAQADAWVVHCQDLSAQWGIDCLVEKITTVQRSEGALRRARYACFAQYLQVPALLLTAHHMDDQAETLLFRLLRGSGLKGLGAIPGKRLFKKGIIIRPFLRVTRADLEHYAQRWQLKWIEDPANLAPYDRNYIRHQVLPLLKKRWPRLAERFAHLSAQVIETNTLLESLTDQHYKRLLILGEGLLSTKIGLDSALLANYPHIMQRLFVRQWLQQQGFLMPSRIQLENLLSNLLTPRKDAKPRFQWGAHQVVFRHRDRLYAFHDWQDFYPTRPLPLRPRLSLPENGTLRVISKSSEKTLNCHGLSVVYRDYFKTQPRVYISARKCSKTLKSWLQDFKVPGFLRARLPLIVADKQLVAIANYWVDELWVARRLGQVDIIWQPPWSQNLDDLTSK